MVVLAALLGEPRVSVAVVAVKDHVLSNRFECQNMVRAMEPAFPGLAIVLYGSQSGRPTYFGHPNLTRQLRNADPMALPWAEYTLNP